MPFLLLMLLLVRALYKAAYAMLMRAPGSHFAVSGLPLLASNSRMLHVETQQQLLSAMNAYQRHEERAGTVHNRALLST